ncbi:MAG: protein kinase [Wenzhouxiangella sp.]|nr:protein kinase [Wenzhouxiangella sp.]TVR94240.1 MAG: serine/threonine-protein kinase [Wenzhouxiangellaceae bacterium]
MSDDFLKPGQPLGGRLFRRFLDSLNDLKEPEPGERIGPWRVVEELGRGGSGAVFLAERADGAFSQQVAIKWLRGDRLVPGGAAVLARERALLASLDHPGIARLVDGGEDRHGQLWFAMDHVAGEAIDAYARDLELGQRVELLGQLCRAVQYAHSRGLIHGDIKPANVRIDERGHPRLLDFGIARLEDSAFETSYGLTPDYASPEQRRGEALTTASDIWQLGRLLEEMTGEELVTTDLEAIIHRAKSEDPERRYASAAALAEDLLCWTERRPVAARHGGLAYRLLCLIRRHRLATLSIGLAAILVAAWGSWMAWQLAIERDLARSEARIAAAALAEAEAALARSNQLRAFLIGLFRAAEPDRPRDRLPDTAALLALGAQRALDPESAPVRDRLGMQVTLAEIYLLLGRREQAGELLDAALALAQAMPPDQAAADLGRLYVLKGMSAMHIGQLDEAEQWLLAAEEAAKLQGWTSDEVILAKARRAWLHFMRGQPERALELLEPIRQQLDSELISLRPETALHVYNTVATASLAAGKLELSKTTRTRAVGASRALDGDESRGYAIQLNNLGALQSRMGDFEGAAQTLDHAIELYDRIFAEPVVLRAAAMGNRAILHLRTGEDEAALSLRRAASAEWALAQQRDPDPDQDRSLLQQLGRFKLRMDRLEEAAASLARALDLYAQDPELSNGPPPLALVWLAHARCRLGAVEEGLTLLEQVDASVLESQPDQLAEYHEARAWCLHANDEREPALEHIRTSLALATDPGFDRKIRQRQGLRKRLIRDSEAARDY